MMPVRFCNYNLDYQQRLGFLKLVASISEACRGGKEDLERRLKMMYSPSAIGHVKKPVALRPGAHSAGTSAGKLARASFDPEVLLKIPEAPSWQPGFSFQRWDRLVLWAEMVGVITPAARLSEWGRPLLLNRAGTMKAEIASNPFRLSGRDKGYFLALLTFHDHVLLHLLSELSRLEPNTLITAREACLYVTAALGTTLDRSSGTGIHAVKARQELRSVLERVAFADGLLRTALISDEQRSQAMVAMSGHETRNHLAEYHAVCRFEQLTDLGILVKEDPNQPPPDEKTRFRSRTTWAWRTTGATKLIGELFLGTSSDVERFLQDRWAQSALALCGEAIPEQKKISDPLAIAKYLDGALARARRQVGSIQVHSWVLLASLDALEDNMALEFSSAFALLDAMRQDPRHAAVIRQSGQQTYLGRTATILDGTIYGSVSQYPIS